MTKRKAAASKDATRTALRNRIISSGTISPQKLLENPGNWRGHPVKQEQVVAGSLEEVGWVRDILINKRTGHMIDGHLRVKIAKKRGEKLVPYSMIDVSLERGAHNPGHARPKFRNGGDEQGSSPAPARKNHGRECGAAKTPVTAGGRRRRREFERRREGNAVRSGRPTAAEPRVRCDRLCKRAGMGRVARAIETQNSAARRIQARLRVRRDRDGASHHRRAVPQDWEQQK
jgi:hypothetical protein